MCRWRRSARRSTRRAAADTFTVTVALAFAPTRARPVAVPRAIGATRAGKKVQQAWLDLEVVQCGYCQSGQIMAATALLAKIPAPTDTDIDQAMSGNICRCGTYTRIREAIKQAAQLPSVLNKEG